MTEAIERIYESGRVLGRSGRVHELHSAIDRDEGDFISSIIRNDPTIHKTLEVGCAYGLSSLYICSAIRDRAGASHTIIDPFQNTEWDGAGIVNLEQAGIHFFELIERGSEFALPQLLEDGDGRFDLVFVDGWHTFDHTMLDCFYATRLLRVGGVLAIDDVSLPSVGRVIEFLSNYPCYQELGSVNRDAGPWVRSVARIMERFLARRSWKGLLNPRVYRRLFEERRTRMTALKKRGEDRRNWDWHVDRFEQEREASASGQPEAFRHP